MNAYHLSRLGSLIAGGGLIWATYAATKDLERDATFLDQTLRHIFMQTGPLEVCGAGVLIWLIGKWRASIAH
ncbi:MAG: hypothetical protein ABIP81_05715 [Terriglobales bacterium]